MENGKSSNFVKKDDEGLYFRDRLYVPSSDVMDEIMKEARSQVFSMHPGESKMFQEIKAHYWWTGMKKSIVEYVGRCLVCQQVKADHQVPSELSQPISIPEWKWDMDFVFSLPLTREKHDAAWGIVDRLIESAHFLLIRVDYSLER